MEKKKSVRIIAMAYAMMMLLSVFSVSALAIPNYEGTKSIQINRSGTAFSVIAANEASQTDYKYATISAGTVKFATGVFTTQSKLL